MGSQPAAVTARRGSLKSAVRPEKSGTTMGNKNSTPVLRDEDVESFSKISGLEPDQIKMYFDAFLEEHPDGRMKPEVVSEIMTKAIPKVDADKMQKHVFRIFDENNNGYVDFIEFMVTFHMVSSDEAAPEEHLGKIFRIFDINNDGSITMKEMSRVIQDMYGVIKAKDPRAQSDVLIAKCAFTTMDKNCDGKVSKEEFISACKFEGALCTRLAATILEI